MKADHLQEEAVYKIRVMRWILIVGLILCGAKFFAWYVTHSNAILTDALESIINIAAAAFGLFSLIYSARPKDENHPYGHGKMEFLAVGFEGGLIFFTGGVMIYKACEAFTSANVVTELQTGIYITASTGFVNFLMGYFLKKKGTELRSLTLKADGQHLMTDMWSSVILLVGLTVIHFTQQFWIDSALTILLGIYIIVVGYKLLRNALAGLMDEADSEIINEVITVLNKERKREWIDIHNLRIVKYGSSIHIDTHLTLPWYQDLKAAHEEVKQLEDIVNLHFKNRVEFFIHTDPCLPKSCTVCLISNCNVRQQLFKDKLEWNSENLLRNLRHSI